MKKMGNDSAKLGLEINIQNASSKFGGIIRGKSLLFL